MKTKFKKYNQYEINIDEIQIPEYILIPLETENSRSTIYIIENQKIEEDQILSKNSSIELNTYSPISGIVEKIYTARFQNGKELKSALIKFQGKIKNNKEVYENSISREKTLEKLIHLGIPWFNENSLFQYISKCKKIDIMILLVNGKDSYTNISEILIEKKLKEILYGFDIINKIFNFKEILIVVSNNSLKKKFEKLDLYKDKKVKIKYLTNTHLYANHEIIMHFLYNNENIQDEINPNKNIILANIEDIYNANLAIKNMAPYKEKFIIINGNKKIKSKILKVKLGTSLNQIINEKIDTKKYEIFINNPASKTKINNFNIPITRDIYSITVLKKKSIFNKIKGLFMPSFSPLHIENIIFSYLQKDKKENNKSTIKLFEYTDKEIEEEITKIQKEIKDKILNENPKNEIIFTENNLKDIYFAITLALLPALIFSFINNTKFLINTSFLVLISISICVPIMFKFKNKCIFLFIYNALMLNIILPLNLYTPLKIITLLFTFLIFFYFSGITRPSKALLTPILISFMFSWLNFPYNFKQTYQKPTYQTKIIKTWNGIINKNSSIKNLERLTILKSTKNTNIDTFEKYINKNIFSVFNITMSRFHIESLLGLNNDKNFSPIFLYLGLSLIIGKYIINKLIPLAFYSSLMIIAYIFQNFNTLNYIKSDILTLIISPIPMLLIFTIATELQIAPHFICEQIIYGVLLAFTYFFMLSYIQLEILSVAISIFILQVSSTLIKKHSLTFKIKKILHLLNTNKKKELKTINENYEDIIKL